MTPEVVYRMPKNLHVLSFDSFLEIFQSLMDLLLMSSLSSLLTTFLSHPTFCGRGSLTRRSLVFSHGTQKQNFCFVVI